MLLVTTPFRETWGQGEKVLFLGEWSKLYSQQEAWSALNHETVPYHWDDRGKLQQDYHTVQALYERCLEELAACLNRIHGLDYSLKYWRVLIGPWLNYYVSTIFDRVESIQTVRGKYAVTNTLLLDFNEEEFIPKNMGHAARFMTSDEFNHYLFGKIIQFFGDIPCEKIPGRVPVRTAKAADFAAQKNPPPVTWKQQIKRWAYRMRLRLVRWFPIDYVFLDSHIPPKEEWRLQWMLGQIPFQYELKNVEIPVPPPDLALRKSIRLELGTLPVERFLAQVIPWHLPILYLEGYSHFCDQIAQWKLPQQTKFICSAMVYAIDPFKGWLAKQLENGSKLLVNQHGGLYGTARWHAMEDHEFRICDRFLSWGWTDPKQSKAVPLPGSKISHEQWRMSPNPTGKAVWVMWTLPRYSYWLYSAPTSSQILKYWSDQERFIQSVSPDLHKQLIVRLKPVGWDYGLEETARCRSFSSDLEIYTGKLSLSDQLKESRLCIATYNATTYLETFNANYPTIIFWDPHYWEIRPAAEPYFEQLREAGIMHDTPESAAALINEIFSNPLAWWQQPKVQKAKNEFCRRFAYTSPNWVGEWRRNFLNLKKTQTLKELEG